MTDQEQLFSQLLALPWAALDADVEQRALEAQRQLARGAAENRVERSNGRMAVRDPAWLFGCASRAGHHRLPPVDLLVAALADRHGLGVLHHDGDYDLIAGKTDLDFRSVWLAERDSL